MVVKKPNHGLLTANEISARLECPLRTVQAISVRHAIGVMLGNTRVYTVAEMKGIQALRHWSRKSAKADVPQRATPAVPKPKQRRSSTGRHKSRSARTKKASNSKL